MRTPRLTRLLLLLTLIAGWGLVSTAEAKIRIRLGTIAPKDSAWHDALKYIRQEWRKISGGEVDVVIIPGSQLGDGPEMVRKVRLGIIQGVALSQVGLSRIDKGVACLHIPMMLESYEELDYVRERIAPRLEQRLEEQGFKVLTWGDAGWVHFFSTTPARTPDDIRKMKLFTSAGDPDGRKTVEGVWLPRHSPFADRHAHVPDNRFDQCVRSPSCVRADRRILQAGDEHDRSEVLADRCRDGDQRTGLESDP